MIASHLMDRINIIFRIPSINEISLNWERGEDSRGILTDYTKVRNFYLRIAQQPNGLFDCTTLKPDPSKGHFNKGKLKTISIGHTSLIESKLWMREWYLKQYDLFDKWIPNDGKNDITALTTRCKYYGDLNIRNDIYKGKYSIVFSNLETGRLSTIEKAIKLPNLTSATDMADLWYERRTK